MAILEGMQLTVRFGGVVAVDDVDLAVEQGSVLGLIGPNGAGKTTLFNVLTGLLQPNSGSVVLDGVDVTKRNPATRARLGLARTFQRLELFDVLTCAENVRVAAEAQPLASGTSHSAVVHDALARVGLADAASVRADELPTGRARLLEVARALATSPKVLLLDEPAAGLSGRETEELSALVRDLASEGLAVVLVEHDMSMVMQVCDQIVVLDTGRVIARGVPDEIRHDPGVIEAYFGSVHAT